MLRLDIGGRFFGRHRFLERRGRVHAEVELQRGAKEGVHVGASQDEASHVLKMGGHCEFEPGAVERRGQDEARSQGLQFLEKRRELGSALGGPLLERV